MPVRELEGSGLEKSGSGKTADTTGQTRLCERYFLRVWGEKTADLYRHGEEPSDSLLSGEIRWSFLFWIKRESLHPAAGGRGKRLGRAENKVEDLLILIDSSIIEIFVTRENWYLPPGSTWKKKKEKSGPESGENTSLEIVEEKQ